MRQRAVEQFTRLGQIKMVARSLQLHTTISTAESTAAPNGCRPLRDPKYFLIQILLKTPVPLWVPSCKSRNSSHQVAAGILLVVRLGLQSVAKIASYEV